MHSVATTRTAAFARATLLLALQGCTPLRPADERLEAGAADGALADAADAADAADVVDGAGAADGTAGCGAEGAPCALPYAAGACRAGACEVVSCEPGHGDCESAPGDGCETSTRNSRSNCGACDVRCGGGDRCVEGRCVDD